MSSDLDSPVLDRPFYFIVALWGERFRNYFLDLCLPSLLSPGNLPALATRRRSKFLIWTRPDDWDAIQRAPIFRLLEQHVEAVFAEIPPCPADTQGCLHMGFGHRRGLEAAYAAKAYPFVLQPDSIFSDGTLRRLQELAAQGVQLALVPALRFAEEPLFDNLRKFGVNARGRQGSAEPIALTGRELAAAALPSMHWETLTYEWCAPYFHIAPSATWWRVPGENGVVVHCLSWAALLLDFAAVSSHDLSTFDNWTIDGDYVYKNLGEINRIHIVLDSDEMFVASWAPLAEKAYYDLTPQPALQRRLLGNFIRKERFRHWFYSDTFDPLKRNIFFRTVRWHTAPINEKWRKVERHALITLLSCVSPPSAAAIELLRPTNLVKSMVIAVVLKLLRLPHFIESMVIIGVTGVPKLRLLSRSTRFVQRMARLRFRISTLLCLLWANRVTIARRLSQILRGDRVARERSLLRLHQAVLHVLGRPRPSPNADGSVSPAET